MSNGHIDPLTAIALDLAIKREERYIKLCSAIRALDRHLAALLDRIGRLQRIHRLPQLVIRQRTLVNKEPSYFPIERLFAWMIGGVTFLADGELR